MFNLEDEINKESDYEVLLKIKENGDFVASVEEEVPVVTLLQTCIGLMAMVARLNSDMDVNDTLDFMVDEAKNIKSVGRFGDEERN